MAVRAKFNGDQSNIPGFDLRDISAQFIADDFDAGVVVDREEVLTLAADAMTVEASLYNKDFLIKGNVRKPKFENLRVSKTTLKNVPDSVLVNELVTFFNDTRTYVNKQLDSGIPIPQLKDKTRTCLDFNDNQIRIQPDFIQLDWNVIKCNDSLVMKSNPETFLEFETRIA